jgi:hypothetical protein
MIMRYVTTFGLIVSLVSSTSPALAQTLTADQKALASYKLTMPTVRKAAAAVKRFNEIAAKDPKAQELAKIQAEIEALNKKDELTEADEARLETLMDRGEALERAIDVENGAADDTIADLEKRIAARPEARAALAAEGLTAREFAMTFMALMQAAMIVGFSQGKVDMAKLPPGVNPENIKFVQENEAELKQLQAVMGGAKK